MSLRWLCFSSRPLLVILTCLPSGALNAQLTRGFISGTVSDPSGAVIVGARVKITNRGTDEEREMVTNHLGIYRFMAVEPGSYTVDYSSSGFQNMKLEVVRVGLAEEVVLNETLEIAGGAATIEVRETFSVTGLGRATPTIERSLEGFAIQGIPLTAGTRDVSRLALLAPTVARGPGFSEISANGQRTRQNNFLIDGTDNNDLTVTVAGARMIPEAIAEFQVQTSSYSAEYGRNTGAQVIALTRSGSNTLHGEVWEFYRANWLEPFSLLNKRAGLKQTPRFIQHQAGGSIGGPVWKDRTFFFGLFEANRRRESPDARNAQPATIPTPKGFSALSNVSLSPGQPLESRQETLNALAFLPEIYRVVGRYENLTTQNVNGAPIEMGAIRIPLANPHNLGYGLVRFDRRFTEKDRLTYRYLFDKRFQSDVTSNRQFGSRFTAANEFLVQNHALSLTHAFSPQWVNEFRFAYSRSNLAFPENDPKSPTVQILGAFTIGGASSFPQGRVSNLFQWQNVTAHLHGRHSFKFGADVRRNRLFNLAAFDSKGTWIFNNLADFLNNRAFSLRLTLKDASFDARQTNQFYFFQDDIRLTRNLNLNLGLRYEYSSVPFGFFGAANAEIVGAGIPLPSRSDKNNLAPRFGIAYSPSPKGEWGGWLLGNGRTAFRAGFGIGYDVLFYNILTVTASNYPRVVRSEFFQPQTINLFPTQPPKQANIPPFNPLTPFANTPTDIQNPATHFWSFSIQRQLGSTYLVEVGYAGNRSYHLLRQGERNPGILTEELANSVIAGAAIPNLQQRRLNPAWGSRATIESTALSKYHALFVRVDRKISNRLLFGGNYSWSANLSDNDESLAFDDIVLSSPQVPQEFFNYRNEWSRSVFDRPHRLGVHYFYEIPWLRSAGGISSVSRRIFSGWNISGFTEWQSGQPFTVRTGVDSGGSGVPIGWRPDYNPNGFLQRDSAEGNLRTFKTPITGEGIFVTPLTRGGLPLPNSMPHGGNLGRNTFRGPSYLNWNFNLAKRIPLSEHFNLQFRADWFNLWNHRNFGNPVATMSSPAFGTNITDPGGRAMLISLKILF